MNQFIIEQTQQQFQLAVEMNRNLELDAIRLARSKAYADNPEIALNQKLNISLEVKAKYVQSIAESLFIEVCFKFAGDKDNLTSKVKHTICAEFVYELKYSLKSDFKPSEEQIKAFQDGNAIHNAWPFCRQYLQSLIVDFGYPPFALPFLRVVTKTPKSQRKLSK